MSPTTRLNSELVLQKGKQIAEDVERIRKMLAKHTYEELVTSEELSSLAERRLERIVNRAIDINFHLIKVSGQAPPDDYKQSFLKLGDLKILPADLAVKIAPAASSRNILVHEYDSLNTKQFYEALEKSVELFPKYLKAVKTYLQRP